MKRLTVTADGWIKAGGRQLKCVLGRGGVREDKREGDGATPSGIWHPEAVLYRSGKVSPPRGQLPLSTIGRNDGWCDAPDDPAYNQPVRHPYRACAEQMWRPDGLYDLVVILDHNRHPVRPHLGSAIFIHIQSSDRAPTEGCIALNIPDLRWLVSRMTPDTAIHVLG